MDDPALKFDRWQFDASLGGRQAGTEINRALPATFYSRDYAGTFGNAIRRLRHLHLKADTLLDRVPGNDQFSPDEDLDEES